MNFKKDSQPQTIGGLDGYLTRRDFEVGARLRNGSTIAQISLAKISSIHRSAIAVIVIDGFVQAADPGISDPSMTYSRS